MFPLVYLWLLFGFTLVFLWCSFGGVGGGGGGGVRGNLLGIGAESALRLTNLNVSDLHICTHIFPRS